MPERVAVTHLDGRRFGDWSELELSIGIDSYRCASLSGPWDPERKDMRTAFEPLAFPEVTVSIGDEPFLKGRVYDVAPSVDATQASVGVTAYSTSYWLTEICAPPDIFPIEFNGLDLKQIATRLANYSLGVAVELDGKAGAKFHRVKLQPDEELHGFLAELALQRGFVVGDTATGDLAFRSEGATGSPVARLKGQPLGRVSAQFNPGRWFSHITGRACKRSGQQHGSKYTQKNELYRAPFPFRHHCASTGDTGSADVPRATKAMVGRMVASAATYTVEDLPTWRDPSGKLWKPNTTIMLTAPGAMIYSETELLIRSIKFKQRADQETATLELVLPGSFGGTLPKRLPWDA
jgi:prophage tail gpP-like protein